MFKSLWDRVKGHGKKAIGYLRSVNGEKAGALMARGANALVPGLGSFAQPFLKDLGEYINAELDKYADAPNQKRRRKYSY